MERLLGLTFDRVYETDWQGNDAIKFESADHNFYLAHCQDCCENVYVDEISGDLSDLAGSPILRSEESYEDNPGASESGTYSFYRLATIKGYVQIRFNGESNGYYSETAHLYEA